VTGKSRGHTLIELLLALFVLSLLAGLVAPMVTGGIHRAKEATLKEDLYRMRKAIADHYADTGRYPADLSALVTKRYLRGVPADPLTESRESWRLVWSDEEG
jgi:general secretion pathway protein G